MIEKLRTATKPLHDKIEKENIAHQIISHDISLDQYKKLLLQNYVAYAITENQIAQHFETYEKANSKRLAQDLASLSISEKPATHFHTDYSINSEPEAWGALYVVLGSTLGGMLIAKNIKKCEELKHIDEHHFFNGDLKNLNSWKTYCKSLGQQNFTDQEEQLLLEKAKETFEFFGKVYKSM